MSSPVNILLVEDDSKLAVLLSSYLKNYSYEVEIISSGTEAVHFILNKSPTLVILDLMLPELDGLAVCQQVRSQYKGKILMLTASGDDMDQVAALEMGADDFVQKPIQPRVLLARIRTLLRRLATEEEIVPAIKKVNSDKEKVFGRLWLSSSLQRCKLSEELIPLTPSEFSLLWHLAEHAEQALSREELLKAIRNIDYDGLDRSIDNKIAQIRKKLKDNASRPKGLITVRGKGYMFIPDYW